MKSKLKNLFIILSRKSKKSPSLNKWMKNKTKITLQEKALHLKTSQEKNKKCLT